MTVSAHVREQHRSHRVGWLRAAVLGANDGIVSVAGLVIGVAAAETARASLVTAGVAGLIAGAVDDLGERGVVFLRFDGFPQDERAIWTAPSGDRIAWFSDPATNTLLLTEFVT